MVPSKGGIPQVPPRHGVGSSGFGALGVVVKGFLDFCFFYFDSSFGFFRIFCVVSFIHPFLQQQAAIFLITSLFSYNNMLCQLNVW